MARVAGMDDTCGWFDTVIVGGGPAGLSAALVLGRCRRRVLVCDAGRPRNAASCAVHGLLTRDGMPPADLRRVAREQLAPYDITWRDEQVVDAERTGDGFTVILSGGSRVPCRTLLIATGVVDRLPEIEGLTGLYGRGVFHCPYCDGWEVRDAPLVAYGRGGRAAGLALSLLSWSRDVTLCSDGVPVPDGVRSDLHCCGVRVVERRVQRLIGAERLEAVVIDGCDPVPARALFFVSAPSLRSPLAEKLGCRLTRRGVVRTGRLERTSVPRLYVAGDASRDVQFVVVAAAEGAKAAVAINMALQEQERDADRANPRQVPWPP